MSSMNKDQFKTLFEQALVVAAQNAQKKLGRPVPLTFEIEMHGLAPHPTTMRQQDALNAIYLGPDRFLRIIDVSVTKVSKNVSTVFMYISGHKPGRFEETWNQPPGSGPVKQLLAEEVEWVD